MTLDAEFLRRQQYNNDNVRDDRTPLQRILYGTGTFLVGCGLIGIGFAIVGGPAAIAASPLVAKVVSPGFAGPMTVMIPAILDTTAGTVSGLFGLAGMMTSLAGVWDVASGVCGAIGNAYTAAKEWIFGRPTAQAEVATDVAANTETTRLREEANALARTVRAEEREAVADVAVAREGIRRRRARVHQVGHFRHSAYTPPQVDTSQRVGYAPR